MNLVTDLANQCIEDDCGYDPLPQHVASFLTEIRDNPKYQSALAEYLQDEGVWEIVAQEVLRGFDDDRDTVWYTIKRLTNAWATVTLSNEVDARIDAVMGGWISEEA